MVKRVQPINPVFPKMIHGADYNPDQWLEMPHIIDEDFRLAKLANVNSMSIGIFSWTALEPSDNEYTFGWLDDIMERMARNNMYAVLATPSGARPAWMSQKYPEVLRVDANRVRRLHGIRHNHCYTSPVFRRKVTQINTMLAQRYKGHPALFVWHLSNEYGGECHCNLCQDAFRVWLKSRYDFDLAALNRAWNTTFWSHIYTDWSQVESPASHGETMVHGHNLDWKRFVTQQTLDFIKMEMEPLKRITPEVPVTTNIMGTYPGLDYWKIAPHLDVISWDNYPPWHGGSEGNISDESLASDHAFMHNINRSLKGKPFMLMESSPSATNWHRVCKLHRPGMHVLASIQAVAHGADTVQYFQFRKSRGASEKFHGAVVDHVGHEHTRVFNNVKDIGEILQKLDNVVGTVTPAQTAIIYDWENRWAIDDLQGFRNDGERRYVEECMNHYRSFWQAGIPCDVIDMEQEISKYKLVIAPMLYMLKPGVAKRVENFVSSGGTFVATYMSGIADEHDLCFLGGWPGPLRKTLGIWVEETDALHLNESNGIVCSGGNGLDLSGEYPARIFCDLMHTETAEIIAKYTKDFYAGMPAVTVNTLGNGKAYYIGTRSDGRFLNDFYGALQQRLSLRRTLDAELPQGVSAHLRTDGTTEFIFIMNFTPEKKTVNIGNKQFTDVVTKKEISQSLSLLPYGFFILSEKTNHSANLINGVTHA